MIAGSRLLPMSLCVLSLAFASCTDTTKVEAPSETAERSNDVVGDVRFETSCAEEVQGAFDSAVATIHSFEFDEARGMFEAIASEDPDCAMAAWGVAMTNYHPLWAPPGMSRPLLNLVG